MATGHSGTEQQQRCGRLLAVLACLSSFLLMLPMLGRQPLALDEHGSYWVIDSDLPGTSLERSLNYAAVPPLSGWMQLAFLKVLGKSEQAFRLSSAICAIAAVPVVYRVGCMVSGSLCGGIAALLLAWHPEAMDEVRIARCYGLVLLLSAVLLLVTVCWMRRPSSLRSAAIWGVASASLLWTHYTSVLLVILCGTAIIIHGMMLDIRHRPTTRTLVAGIGLEALLSLPLLPSVLRLRDWGEFLNFSPPAPSLTAAFGSFWWAGLPVGVVACLVIGFRSVGQRDVARWDWILLGVCSVLPIAALAALSGDSLSSLVNPRYRVAFAPAGVCLAAVLLTWLRGTRGAISGAVFVLLVSWSLAPLWPWQPGRLGQPADQDWRLLNEYFETTAKAGEPIFVQGGLAEAALFGVYSGDPLFMEYVACRVSRFYVATPHPRYALPIVWYPATGTVDVVRRLIDQWAAPESRFWVACAMDTDLNQQTLLRMRQICTEAGFRPVDEQRWPSVVLTCWQRTGPKRGDGGSAPE